MKIKTWKAWHDPISRPFPDRFKSRLFPSPCRIVPEATWKKIMAVVKAAEMESVEWSCVTDLREGVRRESQAQFHLGQRELRQVSRAGGLGGVMRQSHPRKG